MCAHVLNFIKGVASMNTQDRMNLERLTVEEVENKMAVALSGIEDRLWIAEECARELRDRRGA